jgi:hypothetical protein
MHFKFIRPRDASEVWDVPANAGFHEVEGLLDELRARGHTVEIIYGDEIPDEERKRFYGHEAVGAVMSAGNRYSIRQVFGSREHSGTFFGTNIPALIVFDGGRAIDVYPHDTGAGTSLVEYATIRDFLARLLGRSS